MRLPRILRRRQPAPSPGRPPVCWHCGKGRFTELEPTFGTPCCDHCGRDVLSTPGSLPGFDNAGSIPPPRR